MAKYDIPEAYRVYTELVKKAQASVHEMAHAPTRLSDEDVDYGLIDMLGHLLWSTVLGDEHTVRMKQKAVFGCLISAYIAGRESLNEREVTESILEFIETLDIPETVSDFNDLMGWDD